jgi:carbon-monoxide dehydrogenase small subunit
MHPLQQAFWDNHGLQCGFCTPGILMTSLELLRINPQANEQEIRLALSGNICRCTGYQNIVTSILDAAKRMRAGGQA